MADSLVCLTSNNNDGIIEINIDISNDIVRASSDFKGIKKGEIYVRKNTETIKANGKDIEKLIKLKSSELSENDKISKLNRIVQTKFIQGKNNSSEINIFDSLVITSKPSPGEKIDIKFLFDSFMAIEFKFGINIPFSEHSNCDLYINLAAEISKDPLLARIASKKGEIQNKKPELVNRLINGRKQEILNSRCLDKYIEDYT